MITKEEEKEEEDSNRNIHKKPGRKMGKEKMEEAMNRDNVMGTQTIVDKYLSKGTRSAKTLGASMPSKGGSQKPSSIY
jgi:hypothetical protein